MSWFRSSHQCVGRDHPISLEVVREIAAEVMVPVHFYVDPTLHAEWTHHPHEEISWELFQNRLLDPTHSRVVRSFEAWNLYCQDEDGRSGEPVLSVKLYHTAKELHVTRAIYCYAWEGYHAGNNVYQSRETKKWVRELVGTIRLDDFPSQEELADELRCLLFQAVVGNSRLPLTSLEAPLPSFTLGRLGYFNTPLHEGEGGRNKPQQSVRDLIAHSLHENLAWIEKVKLLEMLLRSAPKQELPVAAMCFMERWAHLHYNLKDLLKLLRALFDEVALSPYTDFVDKTLTFLTVLKDTHQLTANDLADFLCYLLRRLVRHLTAYDLITFHHRGANYPDALLLDALLKALLSLTGEESALFLNRNETTPSGQRRIILRRRALRQAWMIRKRYEGLLVPDRPTSPGENARVLPPPHDHLPEDQILWPSKRTKKLYENDPLDPYLGKQAAVALRKSIEDLQHLEELRELGLAIFLDRPLGFAKQPGEPDRTLLLSYEAFSRFVAEHRLRFLGEKLGLLSSEELEQCLARLQSSQINGLVIPQHENESRPGTVSLADAAQVADDFVLLRTTRRSAREFLDQVDSANLGGFDPAFLSEDKDVLIVREPQGGKYTGVLALYDAAFNKRLRVEADLSKGYRSRAGAEFPTAGFKVRVHPGPWP